MAVIKPKNKAVIQKGKGYVYIPETFSKEHKQSNFYEITDPNVILQKLQPYKGKYITFDTETHAHFRNSQEAPGDCVRRWIGSGKSAKPQDLPFCASICDGVNAYTTFGIENIKKLAPIFNDPSIEKIAHNWKYDAHMLLNIGMKIVGRVHDTVLLTKLADENRRSFELRELAAKKKGGIVKFEYMVDAYKQANKISDYRHIPRELLSEYANADVWNAFIVFKSEYEKLIEEELVDLYDKECELMIVAFAMERYGMHVDTTYESPLKEDLQKLTDEAEQKIYEEAGKLFNINSTKQLYEVLIELGVNSNWINKTDKGNVSLNKDALNTLADKHDVSIVKTILDYRKYEKLLTTYAVGIYEQRDSQDKVHCNINQTEATTGRMSITKPALQTLPKKDVRIRSAFIPDEDYTLYFMDLDQVEYRLFAHYAKIPSLLDAIAKGYDVHAATAAMIYNVDIKELLQGIKDGVPKYTEMRSKGKTINFALIYGVGIDHLSVLLKCSVAEATSMKASYFALLPEARTFITTVDRVIKLRGFVKNFYGRKRRLGPEDSYKAPNALIQGCAADYIKNRLVNIFKYLMYHNYKTKILLPVHDEIVIASHKDEQHILGEIRWLLSDFTSFRCPITAGIEKGNPSWGQKVDVPDIIFKEPQDKNFLSYNIYDGKIFNNKEE